MLWKRISSRTLVEVINTFSPVFLFHFQEKNRFPSSAVFPVGYLVKGRNSVPCVLQKAISKWIEHSIKCLSAWTHTCHTQKFFGLFCNHNLSLNQKEQRERLSKAVQMLLSLCDCKFQNTSFPFRFSAWDLYENSKTYWLIEMSGHFYMNFGTDVLR